MRRATSGLTRRLEQIEARTPRRREPTWEERAQREVLRAEIAAMPGGAALLARMEAAESQPLTGHRRVSGVLRRIVEPSAHGPKTVGFVWTGFSAGDAEASLHGQRKNG